MANYHCYYYHTEQTGDISPPYEVTKDLEARERALVSGAAFLSETERQPFGKMSKSVAPNKYNPAKLPSKISFHFNPESKWTS